ncbi:MAG TPA: glycosyltransferase family 2 protein, partial [Acidobacteriota bacterium]|nr:glycosyltransferase family 2 protein [Acidobacteriota bacterium]
SLWLGLNGWDISRLWLWLLGSALFVVVGLQLLVSWVVVRVLRELAQREASIANDLAGHVM